MSKRHGHCPRAAPSPTYFSWSAMNRRCVRLPRYIALGVCDRWRDSFESFLADMGERPSPHRS